MRAVIGEIAQLKKNRPGVTPNYAIKRVVGAAGFEPATCSTQNCRATRLRYTPPGEAVDTCFGRFGQDRPGPGRVTRQSVGEPRFCFPRLINDARISGSRRDLRAR